ncbi:trypco2 family protein [Saccharothrix sp.]|uniref:trypco2 family protein n=1 Tax=Saccharothrix sp. TaxID=1873460 RepID=UPI0028126D6B|nr:trypco2 family protein [Saccharothrix sp.]
MEIELARAVAALRDELLEAVVYGRGQDVTFAVGPIELEFGVELKADVKAKGGFKAWVVAAEVETGAGRGATHRVKVSLTPKDKNGRDLLVGGSSPRPEGPGDVSGHIEP